MFRSGIVDGDLGRMRQEARRILDSLGVSIDSDVPVHSLRLAQQQMVEVARALSDNARILVMDEPTSALSQREVEQLFATITRVTSNGVAVIYISHRMEELFEIGDRVTVLRDGRNVGSCPIKDVSRSQLIRLMANRELTNQFPKVSATKGTEALRVENLNTREKLIDINGPRIIILDAKKLANIIG